MNLISTCALCPRQPKQLTCSQVEEHNEVGKLLQKILQDNSYNLKQTYTILETMISILSRKKGPKSFKKLLDEIFIFMKKYSFDRIKNYQQQIVILNLTYYQKIFKLTFNSLQKIQIILIFAITNIHVYLRNSDGQRLNAAQDKINQINCHQMPQKNQNLENIIQLINSIIEYLRGKNKKAKTMLANLLTKIISEKKEEALTDFNLEIMALCSYYSYLNLQAIAQQDLSYYYLTKALEFGKKIGFKAKPFLQRIKQIGQFKNFRIVKLTRIQNKLQVLNRRAKSSWSHHNTKPKIYNRKQNYDENKVNQQLLNIFTIKDTKATMYKFRKDNMRYLNSQQIKLVSNIHKKQEELSELIELRHQLQKKDDISKANTSIQLLQDHRYNVKKQYEMLKQKHIKQLKPIKTINKYFKTIFTLADYDKMYYVYNFLYGQMISRTKIFLLSLFMRRRIQKIKRGVKLQKIKYQNVLYFVQLYEIIDRKSTQLYLYKKKGPGHYIKIYPISISKDQKAIEDQKCISPETYEILKQHPFYFELDPCGGKLLTWKQYLNRKTLMVIYLVRKFIQKLTKKCKQKTIQQQFKKMRVCLSFGNDAIIETTLFICLSKINQNTLTVPQIKKPKYQGLIFTIGGQKYFNKLYNIKINKNLYLESNSFSEEAGIALVKTEFMKNLQHYIKEIKIIQKFIKLVYCRKHINQLRLRNKILVFVKGSDVISYCKYASGKSYIIAENIYTKQKQIVQTMMDSSLFSHIHLIKDKITEQRTCKEKLKLVCRFIWTKYFVSRLKMNYRGATIMTEFQVSFRNRIIFSKVFDSFLYKRKLVSEPIAITLTVQSLLQFPRPYIMRVFTISKSSIVVDIQYRLYNRQKLYYQKNFLNLNKMLNIVCKKQMEVIRQYQEGEQKSRRNSKFSRNSRNSRNSRASLIRSITNFASEDEVRNSETCMEIVPKVVSKKASLLIKFKNRKSNILPVFVSSMKPELKEKEQNGSQQNSSKSSIEE